MALPHPVMHLWLVWLGFASPHPDAFFIWCQTASPLPVATHFYLFDLVWCDSASPGSAFMIWCVSAPPHPVSIWCGSTSPCPIPMHFWFCVRQPLSKRVLIQVWIHCSMNIHWDRFSVTLDSIWSRFHNSFFFQVMNTIGSASIISTPVMPRLMN